MSPLPHVNDLPSFLDFSPSDPKFTCIFRLPQKGGRQCLNPVHKLTRAQAQTFRDRIEARTPQHDTEDIELDNLLQEYARLCCCKRFHQSQISSLLSDLCERWKLELRSRSTADNEPCSSPTILSGQEGNSVCDCNVVSSEKPSSPHTLISLGPGRKIQRTSSSERIQRRLHNMFDTLKTTSRASSIKLEPLDVTSHFQRRIPEPQLNERTFPQTITLEADTSLQIPKQKKNVQTRSDTRSVPWAFNPFPCPGPETIPDLLRRDLSRPEVEPGRVYIYTRPSDPGFVKIGYTKRKLPMRLSEWERKCNYTPALARAIESPHAKRVEAFVHRALASLRRKESYCKHNKHCDTRHDEWFEISVEAAAEHIQRWADWMRQAEPYGEDLKLKAIWLQWINIQSCFNLEVTSEEVLRVASIFEDKKNQTLVNSGDIAGKEANQEEEKTSGPIDVLPSPSVIEAKTKTVRLRKPPKERSVNTKAEQGKTHFSLKRAAKSVSTTTSQFVKALFTNDLRLDYSFKKEKENGETEGGLTFLFKIAVVARPSEKGLDKDSKSNRKAAIVDNTGIGVVVAGHPRVPATASVATREAREPQTLLAC